MLGSIFLNNFSIFCLSITAKVPPDEEKEVSFRPPADDVDRVDPTEDADTGGGDKLDDSNRHTRTSKSVVCISFSSGYLNE